MLNLDWKSKYLSPSKLCNFVYYKENDFVTEEKYFNDLLFPTSSIYMDAGTALHHFLETGNNGYLGWTIICDLDIEIVMPSDFEVEKWIKGYYKNYKINGRADVLSESSSLIADYKTCSRFEYDTYADSYQWRIYLWMTKYKNFIYYIFERTLNENDKTLTVTNFHKLDFYRYEGLDSDVELMYNEYLAFLDYKKPLIDELLKKDLSHVYRQKDNHYVFNLIITE